MAQRLLNTARMLNRTGLLGLFCVALALGALKTSALTLDELRNTADLTPQKFARLFNNFEFKFRAELQSHDTFLATEAGDCDDYSTLAATVLREKGYTPRLIAVRMPNVVHVVCYIEETGSYLDYNLRNSFSRTVRCDPSIDAIAHEVAKSYRSRWASASEFTCDDGVKRLVATVLEENSSAGKTGRFAALFR